MNSSLHIVKSDNNEIISFDKSIKSLSKISSNVIICFSNLFKKGGSSSIIFFSSTLTIHLKLSWTKQKALVELPTAILE